MLDLDLKNWGQSLKNLTLTELSKCRDFAAKSRDEKSTKVFSPGAIFCSIKILHLERFERTIYRVTSARSINSATFLSCVGKANFLSDQRKIHSAESNFPLDRKFALTGKESK